MPFSLASASQLSRSSRAPLPRWKRATASTGRPRRLRARRKYQAAARSSGSCIGSRASGNCHQPGRSRPASAARSSAVSAREFSVLRSRSSQRAKSGTGDSVTKVWSCGFSREISSHHLLDQEIAERHAGEPALAVGDRIEHRGRRLVRLDRVALHRTGSERSRRESRASARPRRRSAARRPAPDGRRRSSGGRADRCGGADRPSSRIRCTAS